MATKPKFFSPVDVLDINTLLNLTGNDAWECQSSSPTTSRDRASALGHDGDERAFREFNPLESLNLAYKCYTVQGFLTLPAVGKVHNGYHIDRWLLSFTPTDFPVMTVTAHKHQGTTGSHAVDSCRTYSIDLKLPAQFCIPTQIAFAVGSDKAFELKNAAIGMRSLTVELSCSHIDEQGGCGDWLAGENHDGVETINVEFTGVPEDSTDVAFDPSFSRSSDSRTEGNTQVNTRSLTLVKHLKFDQPSVPSP